MFTIEEAATWTPEETLDRLKQVIPTSWVLKHSVDDDGWHEASLLDEKGIVQWSGEHVDQKILFLDALGWFRTRGRKIENPIWQPREREVSLYRPAVSQETPDPPDLDPDEVAAVYKTSRKRGQDDS
jgi:hypothetical protein